ncbi:hypothetical protein Trydic_g22890 [Trypoxylus dichotomus]
MFHTTEIQDGYNWGRLNLQSVTEESSFQEFLSTAELAGAEFQAEKLNIKFINPKANIGLLTKEEKEKFYNEFQKNKDVIKIPRRPSWTAEISADELHEKERDSFLQWRKSLAILQEEKGLLLTPYEKNIEFWKQLWRVLERNDKLLLCDCPGLVMPSFAYTKAEMVINGILPVDQMKDHVPPINLISSLVPRHVIEEKYGIILPKPLEGEDESRCPTAEEILNTYGFTRGFMTANGQPDNPRAARYIIKDFINGKLLYVYPPPDVDEDKFHDWPPRKSLPNKIPIPREIRAVKFHKMTTEELDKSFFNSNMAGVHAKGENRIGVSVSGYPQTDNGKPWKQFHKHANKKKKEKLRRVYAHLDQH